MVIYNFTQCAIVQFILKHRGETMIENLWAFVLIATLIVVIPGVDFLLVTKNTLNFGKNAGHFTTMGIILALFIWTILAVLGLATIVANSIVLFTIIKYLGALYLIWLGIQALLAKKSTMGDLLKKDTHVQIPEKTYRHCFTQGIVTDLLNPKTLLLYVTLMPQFINTDAAVTEQLLILAATLIVISIIWLVAVVYILNIIRAWFLRPSVQAVFNKITGIVLISLGIKLAFERQA